MGFDQATGGAATRGRHVRFELVLTACGLAFTIGTSTWLVWSLAEVGLAEADRGWLRGLGAVVFTASVGAVIYGSLVYQVARLGWLSRTRAHRRASRREMDVGVFGADTEPLVIMVPAYREDVAVVRQTLLSAALQDYPNRRVVLLLDDPPAAADAETEAVRELPRAIEAMLAPMAGRMRLARAAFEDRTASTEADAAEELWRLAELYDSAARWFEDRARGETLVSHIDRHFVAITFDARAVEMHETSARLRRNVGGGYHADECAAAYRRLAGLFDVTLEVFERKRYRNLSHEPNKAMNLNAYLGLLGGEYDVHQVAEGAVIARSKGRPDLVVPDATWVLTLDADSMLVHDYASRLVQRMGEPGMERVGVIQTPYSAVPGAPGVVERIAGATTDIMHVVHQGMTAYDATYWVGANALLRKTALEDIVAFTTECGHVVPRFIQDRTVIEDTESSVDLVARGWSLHNYPERLAFSATPPDYGSLLVQRRRWANGGLIILPKLLRHLTSHVHPRQWLSAWMRVHYLVSIATVNVALLVLMSVPFAEALALPLLPVVAIPYFALYARDLRLAGYRVRDLGHVYALNLLLTPVNMGGVLKSLQQAITRRRIPFGRTPKVSARTPAPALYVLATFALLLLWTAGVAFDLAASRWSHAALAATNLAVLGYAVSRYVGWRNCVDDLRLAVDERLRPARSSVAPRHRIESVMRHRAVQHDNETQRRSRTPAAAGHRRPRGATIEIPYTTTEQDLTDIERLRSWLRYTGEKAAG